MKSKEYELLYQELEKARQPEPSDFWLLPDHVENMRQPVLVKIFKKQPQNYLRELAFQEALLKINKKRLKSALKISKPYYISVRNGYPLSKYNHKHISRHPYDTMLKGIATKEPTIGVDGTIYFSVKLGISRHETALYCDINQDEIVTYSS